MRDPNRIEPIMAEITKMWQKHPDMRLSQFLSNIMGEAYMLNGKRDTFYVEDEEFMGLLREISWLKEDN